LKECSEGGRPREELAPSQASRLEQNQSRSEAGEGTSGLPKLQPGQAKLQQERREGQPVPAVWGVLERRVRLDARDVEDRPQFLSNKYCRELDELEADLTEIRREGTARDQKILRLFYTVTKEPAPPPHWHYFRNPSLEEFQKFRSLVEALSEEKLAETVHKAQEEYRQRKEKFRKLRFWSHDDDPEVEFKWVSLPERREQYKRAREQEVEELHKKSNMGNDQ
jgi:hypothetical protein